MLSFPRAMTTGRRWDVAELMLQRRQEISRTAGGSPIVADLGPALWRGQFRSHPLKRDAADALLADFETLGGALRTFHAHPAERPAPAAVAGVSGLNLQSITVSAVSADRGSISLAGVPAGVTLGVGDWLSITTAAGGRELVRLASGDTADGAGALGPVVVYPALRPAVVAGRPARVSPAYVEMQLEPDTLLRERVGGAWFAVAFSAWQVIR